jgi:hypothetical protein
VSADSIEPIVYKRMQPNPNHPAKFSASILGCLSSLLEEEAKRLGRQIKVLDPMAGVGRIHEIASGNVKTFGVELEPEWALCTPGTDQGNATDLNRRWTGRFDAVATSPSYGNRFADHHEPKDPSWRSSYKFSLGHDLTEGSGAGMQWGDEYRELHSRILDEMVRVTRPQMNDEHGYLAHVGGFVVVNISNHYRNKVEVGVSEWWVTEMLARGLRLMRTYPIGTPRMTKGANRRRVPFEHVIVMRRVG